MSFKNEAIMSRKDYFDVDPTMIIVNEGWNKRVDFSGQDELKKSIIANGVLIPIRVRRNGDGGLHLVDGERRLRATLQAIKEGAEIKSISAIVERRGISDVEALLVQINANDGKPFSPVEEAEVFRQLQSWGMKLSEIATRTGKSQACIKSRLALVDAAPEVKEAVSKKQVTIQDAVKAVKESDGDSKKQALSLAKAKAKRAVSKANQGRGEGICNLTPILDLVRKNLKKPLKETEEDFEFQRKLAKEIIDNLKQRFGL